MIKKPDSLWMGSLVHLLKPHWAWYRRGRTGEGRIVMADENLQGAAVSGLEGARFERCDFSVAKLALMKDIELVECNFEDATMNHSTWTGAQISRCQFHGAWLGLATLDRVSVEESELLGAYLERADLTRATVQRTSFRAAMLADCRFDSASFVECDFRYANLARREYETDLASCESTRFERCDFRGANLDGLRLNNTVFDRCKFFDMIGKPKVEGPVTIIDADFSRGNHSDIRAAKDVLKSWR